MPNILLFIHRVNITTFSIIGIVSCCILMVLIKTKTTMEMKSYRRILIQGCAVDLFFGICTLISAPIILLDNSTAYLVLNSFNCMNLDSRGFHYAITLLWAASFTLLVPSSPIQFVYRYMVFCKNHKIDRLHYVGYLTIPLGITLIYVILVFIGCFPSLRDTPLANENIGFLFFDGNSFKNVPLGLRADANNTILKIVLALNLLTNLASYATIMYCIYQMLRFFKTSSKHIQMKTLKAQAQITKALFCQMLSPIFLLMIPLIYIVVSMFFGISNPEISIILNMGFAWIPIFNCVMTTFCVKPYRRAVISIFSKMIKTFMEFSS